nr:hypothetical protein [uncultured Mucilaginibacter sp.]
MSTAELKEEMHKAVDNIPETALNEALAFLKGLQAHSPERMKRAENFKRILKEDRELLQKLAE